MVQVTVITVGNLKESYWRDAVAEYEKRLGAFCKPTLIQLKEARVADDPSESEILLVNHIYAKPFFNLFLTCIYRLVHR